MENWLFMPESFDLRAEAEALVDAFLEMLQFCPHLAPQTRRGDA